MEFLLELGIEFLVNILFEGSLEISTDQKASKGMRCIALFIVALFALVAIALVAVLIVGGVKVMPKSILGGSLLAGVGVMLLVAGIWKVRRVYCQVREQGRYQSE